MSNNNYTFTPEHVSDNSVLVVRESAFDAILEGLGAGQQAGHQVAEDVLVARVAGVVDLEGGRLRVVGLAPGAHELGAVLLLGLRLVVALQRAVVALVEAPVLVDGDVRVVGLLRDGVPRADRARQHRRVRLREAQVVLRDQFARELRLLPAHLRQRHICPPCLLV